MDNHSNFSTSANFSTNKLFWPLNFVKRSKILDDIEEFFLNIDDAIVSLGVLKFPKPIIISNILRRNSNDEDVRTLVNICMDSIEPYFRTKAFYYSDFGMIDNSESQENRLQERKNTLLEAEKRLNKLSDQLKELKSKVNSLKYSEIARYEERIENKEHQMEKLKEQIIHLQLRYEQAKSNIPTFIILSRNELVNNKPFTEIDSISKKEVSSSTPYTTVASRFFERRDTGEIKKIRSTIWNDSNLSAEYQKFWDKLNNAVRSKNRRPNNQPRIREEYIVIEEFWDYMDRVQLRKLYDVLSKNNQIELNKFHIFSGVFTGYFPQNAFRESRKRKIKWNVHLEQKSKHSNIASLYWLVIALKDLKLFYTYYYKVILKDRIKPCDSLITDFIKDYIDLSDVEIIKRIRIEVSIYTLKIIAKHFSYEDGSVINTEDIYYVNEEKKTEVIYDKSHEFKTLPKYTRALEFINELFYPFIERYIEYDEMVLTQEKSYNELKRMKWYSEINDDND